MNCEGFALFFVPSHGMIGFYSLGGGYGFYFVAYWDSLPPFFELQNAIDMEWKAIQNKQYRLHLELYIGDAPTGIIILEENVEESTIKKLSPRQRNKWYELVGLDNNLPF